MRLRHRYGRHDLNDRAKGPGQCSGRGISPLLIYFLLTLIVPHVFLLSPRQPDEIANAAYGRNIHITKRLAFFFSYDSSEFLRLAASPSGLLEFHNLRQSRPLYVVLAAALTWTTSPLLKWLNWYPYSVRHDAFLAYLILNFGLIFLSLVSFDWVVRERAGKASVPIVVLVFGSVLVVNDVVKVYFWTPHTQIFNILVPLICLAACVSILEQPQRSFREVFCWSLGLGVLVLAYGSFLMILPAAVLAFYAGPRLSGASVSGWYVLSRSVALVLGFCFPTSLWILFVHWKTGKLLYSHEITQYHQFVWMVDALRAGGPIELVHRLASFVRIYADATLRVAITPILLLLASVLIGFFSWIGKRDGFISTDWNSVLIAAGITAVVTLLFFGLLGFYADRLAWNIVPTLLVVGAAFGSESSSRVTLPWRRWGEVLWIAVGIAWLLYEVVKPGPYS
jgi:hypothetical protein